LRALLIGGGGREYAIALSIVKSGTELIVLSHNRNPGLLRIARKVVIGDENDRVWVLENALRMKPDYVFIGPESPLAAGITDTLLEKGLKVFAPSSTAARLETSKSFCREFMRENGIGGNVDSTPFSDPESAEEFVRGIDYDFVIKPDGLTGGKGVVVQGIHFRTREEGMKIIREYLSSGAGKILVERRMIGEEFSLQAFAFGRKISFLPVVQDYKRARENDEGPNTGGMGSICFSERGLPFITPETLEGAKGIMTKFVNRLAEKGVDYVGPIYGGFISTSDGPKLLEINARLGDPEAINVLALMENSIVDVASGMYNEQDVRMEFRDRVNVLRYIVPVGYGERPLPSTISIEEEKILLRGLRIFYASVNKRGKGLMQTSSRSLALLSEGRELGEAVARFDGIASLIRGKYFMREDIGTEEMIGKKKRFMDEVAAGRA
jgi:phosphoribosylamine--glycine ligase